MTWVIGVCDTMFARADMFQMVRESVGKRSDIIVERYTVPGIKDLPVAAKRLFELHSADIVIALGMPGPHPLDKMCAHEASLGLGQVQLLAGRHILEVFVHTEEGRDDADLLDLTRNRVRSHAENALLLLKGRETLSPWAGKGIRQGRGNEGSIE